MAKEFKRYLVTSALPYANGPVHIGHLAGVYIPSDIYTRYLRLKGCDVISVCGSDEHGVPITIKARKEGVTPQQIVDRYHELIKRSFEGLGMSFDIYSRTSSALALHRLRIELEIARQHERVHRLRVVGDALGTPLLADFAALFLRREHLLLPDHGEDGHARQQPQQDNDCSFHSS